MKAVLCKQWGPPATLVVEEVATPPVGPGQVLISMRAAGVNFPDTLIIEGKYQFKPPFPFSPGAELAGVVKEVGAGVKHVKVGDSAIAFVGWGGFAEEVVADGNRVFPIPAGSDFRHAAAFTMVYGTSYHALKDRAQLAAGEIVLVLGAGGGVGLAAVELAAVMGAKVIAAASSEEKLAACREKGAQHTVNYTAPDWREQVKAITGGRGVDVVYDAVGGEWAEPALRLMAWRGRYLVVGFAGGDIPRLPFNLPLLKGCSVVGVFLGEFLQREPEAAMGNMMTLFKWMMSGKITPHIHAEYPLERAAEAISAIAARQVVGKVVVVAGN